MQVQFILNFDLYKICFRLGYCYQVIKYIFIFIVIKEIGYIQSWLVSSIEVLKNVFF